MARGFGATLGSGTTDLITTLTAVTLGTQYSLAIWANENGAGGGNLGRMIDRAASPNWNRTGIDYRFTDQQWSVELGAIWSIATPSAGWHRFVITTDNTAAGNVPIIYMDGTTPAVTTVTASSGVYTPLTTAFLLGNSVALNRNWDGLLAEFGAWNRILTPDEALALSNGFTPKSFMNGLLTGYSMLRENWGTLGPATISGTAVQSHPRTIYPGRRRLAMA